MEETVVSQASGSGPANGAPRRRFAVGDRLGDRYEIRAVLGAGGMGSVYRALDETLGVEVALKVVAAGDLERLRAEVRLAQKVTHVNVCRTYDLEDVDGLHVVKMEHVPGDTLASIIAAGPLPLPRALAIARGLAAGLAAAHAAGIVHRDLKPANVIVSGDRAALLDFGVATEDDDGSEAGTPGYMSPELLAGEPVDTRGDLYALGCVVFEMLAGAPVFAASSPVELAAKHARSRAPDVRARRPEVPRWLARAVAELLAKTPEPRPRGVARLVRGPRRVLPFAVTAVAAVALVAIGSLATRGGDEVDEGGQQARLQAERERAMADATLAEASRLLDTDAARAIAMLRPLAAGERWVEARAVAAAAHARAPLSQMKGPDHTAILRISDDGERAVAVGTDNSVWLYDLVAHTSTTIAMADADPTDAFLLEHHGYVVARPRHLRVHTEERDTEAFIGQSRVAAQLTSKGRLFVLTEDGELRRSDTVLGDLVPLGAAQMFEADPTGDRAAVIRDGHLLLGTAEQLLVDDAIGELRGARQLLWSRDGSLFAARTDDELVLVEADSREVRRIPFAHAAELVFLGNRLLVRAADRAAVIEHGELRPLGDDPIAQRATAITAIDDGTAAVLDGRIVVHTSTVERTLQGAPGHIECFGASRLRVVAAGDGRVYAWDLAGAVPVPVTSLPLITASFVTREQLIGSTNTRSVRIGLTGSEVGYAVHFDTPAQPSPHGEIAIAYSSGMPWMIGIHGAQPLDRPIDNFAFCGDGCVATTANGRVSLLVTEEMSSPAWEDLVTRAGTRAVTIAATPRTVAASFSDGTLWRYDLASKVAATTPAPGAGAVAITDEGDVVFVASSMLSAWRPDGSIVELGRIDDLRRLYAGPNAVYAATGSKMSVFTVSPPAGPLSPAREVGRGNVPLPVGLVNVVADARPNGVALLLFDEVAGTQTSLVDFDDPTLPILATPVSPDDRLVFVATAARGYTLHLDLPHTRAENVRWLDELTNATLSGGKVAWR